MPPPRKRPRERVIRFRKNTLAHISHPHKETEKKYFSAPYVPEPPLIWLLEY
jgi:hypothetical protein